MIQRSGAYTEDREDVEFGVSAAHSFGNILLDWDCSFSLRRVFKRPSLCICYDMVTGCLLGFLRILTDPNGLMAELESETLDINLVILWESFQASE